MLTFSEKCAIPVFEGLLEEPHNTRIMKLLYRTAEWHALAKLRMHSDSTLTLLEDLTVEFGKLMRQFRDLTCSEPQFQTVELPRETAARYRRQTRQQVTIAQGSSSSAPAELIASPSSMVLEPAINAASSLPPTMNSPSETSSSSHSPTQTSSGSGPKKKGFNLITIKFHFLGDYVRHIRLFGTTDSYSTQLVCNFSNFTAS
jgi:hypothetical protein